MTIEIKNLNYIYNIGSPFEKKALDNINLKIETGEFIGIIGQTGSGKSTLIQQLNALLKPSSGDILIDGKSIVEEKVKAIEVRKKVGMVFQYPEHQLFEETVYKDIAFGPKNLKMSEEDIESTIKQSMKDVGLDYETYKDKSPFQLSGGEKRRVAIAGVLAMNPETIILDEPTAGLDPKGSREILDRVKRLNKENRHMTIILVSHIMEDIANLVDKIIVINDGVVELFGTPEEVFDNTDKIEEFELAAPQITYLMKKLNAKYPKIRSNIYNVKDAKDEILRHLRRNKNA